MQILKWVLSDVCCVGRAGPASNFPPFHGAEVIIQVVSPIGDEEHVSLKVFENDSVRTAKRKLELLIGVSAEEIRLLDGPDGMELPEDGKPFVQIARDGVLLWVVRSARLYEACSRWCRFRYRCNSPADAERFNDAVEGNDILRVVELLASDVPIECVLEPKHPWVADPRSIGALAAAQLASAAAPAEESGQLGDEEDHPLLIPVDSLHPVSVQTQAYRHGVVPHLVRYLKSDQEDRQQVSVLALRFLMAEPAGAECAIAAHQEGAMPLLIKAMDSPIKAQASAAASALRNIFITSSELRKSFVDQGGIQALVRQLGAFDTDGGAAFQLETLETVLNFQDLLDDHHGGIPAAEQQRFAQLAIEYGAVERLRKLQDVEDLDLQESARELLDFIMAACAS